MGPPGVGWRINAVAHLSAGLSLSRGERLLVYVESRITLILIYAVWEDKRYYAAINKTLCA